MFQKVDDLLGFDRSLINPEKEIPHGNPGNGSQIVPVKRVLKNWSLPLGRPSADTMRLLAHSTFIDKHYRSTLFTGFFFKLDQPVFFQRAISASFLSMALPMGF